MPDRSRRPAPLPPRQARASEAAASADEALLSSLQESAFGYFVREADPGNGLVRDKTAADWPASIAAVGMALSCYPVGVERGFMSRADAVTRTLTTLRFFAGSEQGRGVDATGYRGFYYHFLHLGSGQRAWRSELSSIDTALLIAGVLCAAQYFDAEAADEAEVRALARMLYERVDWRWMLGRQKTLCHGWRPEGGGRFLQWRWEGYAEALILYLLALGAEPHGIDADSYRAWCAGYQWKEVDGIGYLHAGPLFTHQLSHAWVDLRGVRDAPMRAHDSDYFENSRRATLVQQRYAIRNPLGSRHVGALCWGLSASDGPGPKTRWIDGARRVFFDYAARGVPDGPDDGTLAPWTVAASLPFAPEIVLPTLHNLRTLGVGGGVDEPGSLKAFNPLFTTGPGPGAGWVSKYRFGINEGPTVLMIENHRSGLIWALMRSCLPLRKGLLAAGFEGGWLGA